MLTPGTLLQNRYHILQHIGGGGMGEVYLAEDTRLSGHRCAIKEMSPAQVPPQDRNWAISAFKQEAQMLALLRHPGLTSVTDFFAEKGNWYLVMDYVEGETLDNRLQRISGNRLPLQETLGIVHQLCSVLDYLHAQNPPVIFRDLKPSNVILAPSGEVRLIDFGIARFFKPGQTRDTVKLGTPGYAAPEQGGRGQTDARSDIYSLGVILHQMLTGYDPTMTPMQLPLLSALNVVVPPQVEVVVQRATQIPPYLRFQSINELSQVLFAPVAQPPPPPPVPVAAASSRWLWLLSGVGLGLVCLLVFGVIALGSFFSSGSRGYTPAPTFVPAVADVSVTPEWVTAAVNTRLPEPTRAPVQSPPTEATPRPQTTPTVTRAQVEAAVINAVERFQKAKEYSQKTGDTSRLTQDLSGQALSRQIELVNQTRSQNCYWDIWLDVPMRYEFPEVLGDSYVRVKVFKVETRHRYCNGQPDRVNWVDKESYDTAYGVEQINGKWYVTQRE